ncbi:hypothetical protein NKH48_34345 [Mesorhizobium sp. M1233]|uniref:hypothetical protein n=1 Tax=Mesorhizobium sp. M1233 TaxID=2957072 RepID=UPI00333CAA4B
MRMVIRGLTVLLLAVFTFGSPATSKMLGGIIVTAQAQQLPEATPTGPATDGTLQEEDGDPIATPDPNPPPSNAAPKEEQISNPPPSNASPNDEKISTPPFSRLSTEQARRGSPWDSNRQIFTSKHPWEIYLSAITISLLVFMALLLVLFAWRTGTGFSSEFQRAFLLLTVIFAALYLIVAGYSDDQTAPVFSLLGAIIGYLFGRAPGAENERPSDLTPRPNPGPLPPAPTPPPAPVRDLSRDGPPY